MSRVLYICIMVIIGSCAQHKEEGFGGDNETSQEMVMEDAAVAAVNETITYQHLAAQKLQDYFDLLVLKKQHPEFQEDINLQLKEFSYEDSLGDAIHKISIKNVRNIGEIVHVNDSVQKINLRFDIDDGIVIKTDSITATIYIKKIELEDKEVISTKMLFSKN